jgi:uncharacterized protein YjiS (DUF1127 family)
VVFRRLALLATALKHRREVLRLADLDDRALKDIGLMRSDVEFALAERFFRDPSRVLVRSWRRDLPADRRVPERSMRPVVPVVRSPLAARR